MPGIAGIIGSNPTEDKAAVVRQMVESMLHEPFYTSGTYAEKPLGLGIGWVGRQGSSSIGPLIWNETKDVCMVFSGESFGDKRQKDSLREKGHEFDSGNASFLLHLYEEEGLDCIEKLNGRFSCLMIDRRTDNVYLFNDRYGSDRLYYHEGGDGFYFATEAKALLRVLPHLRTLDLSGLAETFSHGCVLQDRSIFPGVKLLPGGSLWRFTKFGPIIKGCYFSREHWERQSPLSVAEFEERLRETFCRVLPHYFAGDEKIAMSLTGGLDGRMIMAWADRPPGTLPCYTFGSSYRESTDVRIARSVARVCGQPHETIAVGPELFAEFPCLAERAVYISDGAMDVTGAVELQVNSIARGIAPVRMTGNYGSEIVRGNVAFKPAPIAEAVLAPEFARNVRAAAAIYAAERRGSQVSFIAFKQVPWHHYSRLAVELSQLTMRAPYLDNEIVALMYQAPPELLMSKGPSFRVIGKGNPKLAAIPTDRGLQAIPVPVVTRLRHLYEEFTFKVEYAYDYGMPPWLAVADHAFSWLHLERLFLGRHKFSHFRVWYRDQLSDYVKAMLLDARTLSRPYLNGRNVERLVLDHTTGRKNYTREIHRLLTCELIERTLVDLRE